MEVCMMVMIVYGGRGALLYFKIQPTCTTPQHLTNHPSILYWRDYHPGIKIVRKLLLSYPSSSILTDLQRKTVKSKVVHEDSGTINVRSVPMIPPNTDMRAKLASFDSVD